jgi:hypothetical protein
VFAHKRITLPVFGGISGWYKTTFNMEGVSAGGICDETNRSAGALFCAAAPAGWQGCVRVASSKFLIIR